METVQFSIPTAEILPPSTSGELASETAAPEEWTPIMHDDAGSLAHSPEENEALHHGALDNDPYAPPAANEHATEQARELSPEPAASLSDWEARLKRAMADEDDELGQAATLFPTYEPVPQAVDTHLGSSASHEFAVPESDLVPDSQSDELRDKAESWVPESPGEYIDEDDLTVKTIGDQTVKNYVSDTEAPGVEIVADDAPRKKRKRSVMRTFLSASLGVVGIPIGLYVLLWLRGPAGDVVNIAQYLPSFMLPSGFNDSDIPEEPLPAQIAAEQPLPPTEESLTEAEDTAEETTPAVRRDPQVAPASAVVAVYRGPKFDLVDSEEFAELLSTAEVAAPQLGEGDLGSKESVSHKGQAYMALARLAEKSSFLNQPGLTPEQTAKTLLAKQLFESTMRDKDVARDLPQIALRWWQYAERPSSGVIFVGRIGSIQANEAGEIAYVSLDTEPVAPEIPVLMAEVTHSEGELIGIVGSIMADAQQRLPTVGLPAETIVVAHYSFPVIMNSEYSRDQP